MIKIRSGLWFLPNRGIFLKKVGRKEWQSMPDNLPHQETRAGIWAAVLEKIHKEEEEETP